MITMPAVEIREDGLIAFPRGFTHGVPAMLHLRILEVWIIPLICHAGHFRSA